MTDQDMKSLRELVDRQEIYDCVLRYCRGVDRFDERMMRSAYHEDAIDDHGTIVAAPDDFVDWAFDYHSEHQHGHHHAVSNHYCELSGDEAHTETYWTFVAANKEGPLSLHFGRYLDRFERRNGKWGIVARRCLAEWHGSLNPVDLPAEYLAILAGAGTPSRDGRDPSWERPLEVKRAVSKTSG